MLIPPKYQLTPRILELISQIEINREIIRLTKIPPEIEQNIRRQSTLKSSLFSARIEGNPFILDDLIKSSPSNQKRLEIYNILKALNWIKERNKKELTSKDLLALHKIAMKGLTDIENLGKFRKNAEAIFNSAGFVVFMPPSPKLVQPLINKLIKFVNNSQEHFIPIRAVLAHYSFEKIHPFLDGSGRVGRLLIQLILKQRDYGMKGILPLEEYLDNHRGEYYRMLEEPQKNMTHYAEFMLEAISEASQEAKKLILEKPEIKPENLLLPRRAEIVRIIKDHKIVNFDQIKRRFIKINERTLRYDLKKLKDQGFIKKLGATRGVYYQPA